MPELSLPTTQVHASYLEAIKEYQREGGYPDFDDLDLHSPGDFAAYVAQLRQDPRRVRSAGMPPMTLLWWIEGATYLGRLSIWHRLAGDLVDSGHIGYHLRPTARGRGLATAMLAAALPFAARLDIDPALATVHVNNLASRKVIEANGGQLIDERDNRLYYHVRTAGHLRDLPPGTARDRST